MQQLSIDGQNIGANQCKLFQNLGQLQDDRPGRRSGFEYFTAII
jgi:hypothetical protein